MRIDIYVGIMLTVVTVGHGRWSFGGCDTWTEFFGRMGDMSDARIHVHVLES